MASPGYVRQADQSSPDAYDVRPRLESEQEYFTEVALQESRRWIEVIVTFALTRELVIDICRNSDIILAIAVIIGGVMRDGTGGKLFPL